MPPSDGPYRSGRHKWVVAAFVALSAVFIGMKCLCPDPSADLFRGEPAGVEVRGAPLRAAPAPQPEPAAIATLAPPPIPPPPPPAPITAPVIAAPAVEKPAVASPYATKTWDDLSKFLYVPPMPPSPDPLVEQKRPEPTPIPEEILALSGKSIAIEGYCVPLDYEKGIVKKFVLVAAPLACCFAEAPPMNHWMMVTNGALAEFDAGKYDVVRVSGVFDAGEETRDGYVVGIYRMKAEKVEIVQE